jgi:hypothetical protein
MKLKNFELTKKIGKELFEMQYIAEVDVTTWPMLFPKTVRRKIYRKHGENWIFIDTGEYTPGFQAEKLEKSYLAQIVDREN